MPDTTTIEQIMTKGVFTVDIEDTIHKADLIMREENVRHVPVLENDKFIGIITERSLMIYSLRQLYDFEDDFGEEGRNKIIDFRDVMTKDVHVVYPEDSVRKAIEIMVKRKVDCLPVVDWKNHLVGIITSIDVLLYVYKQLG